MKKSLLFLPVLILFWCSASFAQITPVKTASPETKKTPCLIWEDNQWKLDEKNTCVQFNREAYEKKYIWSLEQLKTYKGIIGTYQTQKDFLNQKLLKSWDTSEKIWGEKEKKYKTLVVLTEKQVEVWKTAFEVKQKFLTPHWSQSPILWFAIGVTVTTAVVIGAALVLNSLTSQK